jgi:hypothetical protein
MVAALLEAGGAEGGGHRPKAIGKGKREGTRFVSYFGIHQKIDQKKDAG